MKPHHRLLGLVLSMPAWACMLAAHTHKANAQQAPKDMTGSWAQLQLTTAISSIPIFGDITTTTRTLLLLDVQQFKHEVLITETICRIDIKSSSTSVRTIIPAPFLSALSGKTRRATIITKSNQAGQSTTSYMQHAKLTTVGAKLKNPQHDALPSSPQDARVYDADRDGKPGVTVYIRGIIDGNIHLVQRGWNRLRGTFVGPDTIQGSIAWNSEQIILSATSIFLSGQPSSRPHKSQKLNRFTMRRVPSSTTCDAIVKQQRNLFSWPS